MPGQSRRSSVMLMSVIPSLMVPLWAPTPASSLCVPGAISSTGHRMSLDVATLRRIARLARIRIDDPTLERLGAELGAIIGWVEQLDEVDIEGRRPE